MKTIIAGSRNLCDSFSVDEVYELVEDAVHASNFEITEIVSGGARCVDTLAIDYALSRKIPYRLFPVSDADWRRDPRGAGVRRNEVMACYSEALVAVTSGTSGTGDMIRRARSHQLLVYVYRVIVLPR